MAHPSICFNNFLNLLVQCTGVLLVPLYLSYILKQNNHNYLTPSNTLKMGSLKMIIYAVLLLSMVMAGQSRQLVEKPGNGENMLSRDASDNKDLSDAKNLLPFPTIPMLVPPFPQIPFVPPLPDIPQFPLPPPIPQIPFPPLPDISNLPPFSFPPLPFLTPTPTKN